MEAKTVSAQKPESTRRIIKLGLVLAAAVAATATVIIVVAVDGHHKGSSRSSHPAPTLEPTASPQPTARFVAPDFGFPKCYSSFADYGTEWTDATDHYEMRPLTGHGRYPYSGSSADECDALTGTTIAALGPHWSPIGLAKYAPASSRNALLIEEGTWLVASHGSWNRNPWIGYRVDAFELDGSEALSRSIFVPPLREVSGNKRIRPVDVRSSPVDGSLLMTADRDDYGEAAGWSGTGGGLYRIVYDSSDVASDDIVEMPNAGDVLGGDSLYALARVADIPCARQIAHSTDDPTLVYVSTFDNFCPESSGGRIYAVELDATTGNAVGVAAIVGPGLNSPQGIDWSGGTLYMATAQNTASNRGNCVLKIDGVDDIARTALAGGGTIDDADIEDVACGWTQITSGHSWRSLRVDPSGSFAVIGIGADCNWATDCQPDESADPPNYQTTLVKVDLASADVSVLVYGVRNVIGMAFDGDRLFFTAFGSDNAAGIDGGDYNNVPECELNVVELS